MMDRLKNFPFMIIFFAYLAYLGFGFYQFQYSDQGEVRVHETNVSQSKTELEGIKVKLEDAKRFTKSLDLKKEELRNQFKKLTEYQGMLSEELDVPSLIKVLLTEAKRIQLKVDRIEPGRKMSKDYYLEQEFRVNIRGTFHQFVLFSQRLSQLQRILRVEAFGLKPFGDETSKALNQLSGQLSIRAYQYTASKEDSMAEAFK